MFDIVFDLDGTLVDSKKSVFETYYKTFAAKKFFPSSGLDERVFSLPLDKSLVLLFPNENAQTLEMLKEAFISEYDSRGFRHVQVFPQVEELLSRLKVGGHRLFIATSKRSKITKLLVRELGWEELFIDLRSPDSYSNIFNSKAEIIQSLMMEWHMNREDVLYVGDSDADEVAADEIKISFAKAAWGLATEKGLEQNKSNAAGLLNPLDLIAYLDHLKAGL
jgi:phosphoglycolate phosphatase